MKARSLAVPWLPGLLFLTLLAGPPREAQAAKVTFRFQPSVPAKAVYVAGEFNSWNATAQAMADADADGVFEVTIDLAPGRYQYKYVIEGTTWQEDPYSTESVPDPYGGKNSVLVVPEGAATLSVGLSGAAKPLAATPAAVPPVAQPAVPVPSAAASASHRNVYFAMQAKGATAVFLAGEFNSWSATAQAMSDADGNGVFDVTIPLAPGHYQYKYVIDGTWKEDPRSAAYVADPYGGKNSIVEVSAGEGVQEAATSAGAQPAVGRAGAAATAGASGTTGAKPAAPAVAKPASSAALTGQRTVTFRYQPPISGVREIFLAGTFNDWNVGATPMRDQDGDGVWEAMLLLAPGDYEYKFVADGTWITDEKADAFVDDPYGGKNSVIHVDDRFKAIDVKVGDGKILVDNLGVTLGYSTVDEVEDGLLVFQARAYRDDVQKVVLHWMEEGKQPQEAVMMPGAKDAVFASWTAQAKLADARSPVRFTFSYHDKGTQRWATAGGGFAEQKPDPQQWIAYSEQLLPPFRIPQWAQTGIYYQIFPDRFGNGDPSNDQDFKQSYYKGRNELPAGGKTNAEYFHVVKDWDDVSGLAHSPYRTDGKPDYYSFYGGDVRGVIDHIPYLASLGITIIYFNPVNDARSNHRYDACDYLKLDPHLGTDAEFAEMTRRCAEAGIRVIVDMALNHTGDCHFAFQDAIAKWKDSPYYDWYEWQKRPPSWPLPSDAKASDYYDCWWGFGLHPNLNYDLSRPNAQENGIVDIAQAKVNSAVVDYVLQIPEYWMGKLGCSGFRLDVPNEVPFWFWGLFRERCRQIKPDHVLIGEIWGDAGAWINPHVFDAVMNYRYFKDPVVKWIGQRQGNAATFDQELAPGRTRYPIQAVRAQMNLVDSHDTVRLLNVAGGDVRRLMLAATFAMTYLGAPHIYYGDELGLAGDKDPDCRRTMPWSQIDVPARKQVLEHYRRVTALRRAHPELSLGAFQTVLASGDVFAYLREHQGRRLLVVLNNGESATTTILPVGNAGIADGATATPVLGVASEITPVGGTLTVGRGVLKIVAPPVSGIVLEIRSERS